MKVTRFAPVADRAAAPRPRLFARCSAMRARGRSGGQFLLRIEDLDPGRCRPEFVAGIEEDLRWLGLDWDGEPIVQSRADASFMPRRSSS